MVVTRSAFSNEIVPRCLFLTGYCQETVNDQEMLGNPSKLQASPELVPFLVPHVVWHRFEQASCLLLKRVSPMHSWLLLLCRGRYTVELCLGFLRLSGQANDFKIQYPNIVRIFQLPKVGLRCKF